MVITLVGNIAGAGKTTSAVSIAVAYALNGQRVLLIDLDAQGGASRALGVAKTALTPSIANVLLGELPAADALRKTSILRLSLLTGSTELADVEELLADIHRREQRLADIITPLQGSYDTIVIDTPSSLSLLTLNALVAAEYYVVPFMPHQSSLETLVTVLVDIEQLYQGLDAHARLLGILMTRLDYHQPDTAEYVNEIRNYFEELVFDTEIRTNRRLQEAPTFGQSIFEFDRTSAGADAYRRFASEVRQRSLRMKGGTTHDREA